MASNRYPPLPSLVRPVIRVLRVGAAVAGLAALIIVVVAIRRGVWSAEFAFPVIAIVAFAGIAWIHPFNAWFLPALSGFCLVVALVERTRSAALAAVSVAAMAAWMNRPGRRIKAGTDPERIRIAEPTAAMRNARHFIRGFTTAGFEQVGALRLTIGPARVVSSLLLSPDARSYAAVTDVIFTLESWFPEGRSLETSNSARTPRPASVLTNALVGGTPRELLEAHGEALDLLADAGHFPIAISARELPQIALDSERAGIEWANHTRPPAKGHRTGLLLDDPDRDAHIALWHGAPEHEG